MLAMPLLAERLKVPDMVMLLLAGTLFGPNGAGLLERNTAVTLFGSVGLLYIMFLAGLEIDLHRFAKMEPIIGAFLAGAAFNRVIPEHSALMNRVVFAGHTLFIPFFLISVGMMLDPAAVLSDPRSWLVGITMIITVVVTKFAAAWLAGMLFGYERAARKVMFGLSVVQAAAAIRAASRTFAIRP